MSVETVEEQMARWNPPPQDSPIEFKGTRPPEGDGRATNLADEHVAGSQEEIRQALKSQAKSGGSADQPLKPLGDMDKSELQDEAERRGLSRSGNKEDLKQRILDHIVNGSEADDDEEPDDEEDGDEGDES